MIADGEKSDSFGTVHCLEQVLDLVVIRLVHAVHHDLHGPANKHNIKRPSDQSAIEHRPSELQQRILLPRWSDSRIDPIPQFLGSI